MFQSHGASGYFQEYSTPGKMYHEGHMDITGWIHQTSIYCIGGKTWRRGRLFLLKHSMYCWLVVSTHLKNISQIGNLLQIGVNIKNI